MVAEQKIMNMSENHKPEHDGDRALNYEENLLWEKARSDTPGVDLPEPAGTASRTGLDELGGNGSVP